MQTSTLGRIVLARTDPDHNNGADVCPAIITRVWDTRLEHGGHEWASVNLQLFRDGQADVIDWATSVRLFADAEAAERWAGEQDHPVTAGVAYWPPRVG